VHETFFHTLNSLRLLLGGIDRVHREWRVEGMYGRWNVNRNDIAELVFRASQELETIGKIGYKTLQLIQQVQGFDGNPLYAILHEAIYCQGSALPSAFHSFTDEHYGL